MAHLLKSRDPHLAGGEKWSFFSWGRWGRPASFNSLQTYVPHPPSLRDDHRGHDRRHRHPHRPCHCHFHSHLQKFFPNSVIGVFSHSKGPGAGRNSQSRTAQGWEPGSQEGVSFSKRIPSKGSQVPRNTKRFPRGSQARFPGTGSQARVPSKRFPSNVPRKKFPSKGSQQEVPKQSFQEDFPK